MSDDFWDDFKGGGKGIHLLFQQLMSPYYPITEDMMHWKPFIDMYEADDKLIIMADIAGVDPKEIKLVIKGNFLYIKGYRKPFEEANKTKLNYYEMEIRFGPFERIVPLPYEVNKEDVKVETHNGLLRIEFVKSNQIEKIIPID